MVRLIDNLVKTGLTRQESELYIALCREGSLTGYEAAKITGISRSNAYQALAGLVDKGGAYVIEGAVSRYAAVPVEEYCANVVRSTEEIAAAIKRDFPAERREPEGYITISGAGHIINKMKNIIQNAKARIYVSMAEKELEYIRAELSDAVARGLKVVVITSAEINMPGTIVHMTEKKLGQIRVIADSSYVLTGEIVGDENDVALYSKNRPLIELLKESLTNEIKLEKIQRETRI